ncbi:unnamed protein product [Schistocephalus solidus]|uniref:Spt5-NGN domain-containing protein n=1 Tax=Schistocephalus solidus TaxID=70667 RepID=A0A183SUD5_SCHSO|nr:unnamed protein product [Schistocephalus solidus]
MPETWMVRSAEEIQGYADQNKTKNLFESHKPIYGQYIAGTVQLFSSNGKTLLLAKSEILLPWAERFKSEDELLSEDEEDDDDDDEEEEEEEDDDEDDE